MSAVTTRALNMDPATVAKASPERRRAMLRQAVDETVGVTFFGEMLKIARNSRLKGKYMHGGRGEEIFQGQLDMHFAREIGRGMPNSLSDAIYKRFEKHV